MSKDYSGCEFYDIDEYSVSPYCRLSLIDEYHYDCKQNPNCHYKQLQAKTNECEELKEKIERFKSQNKGALLKIIDNERKENIALKQQLDTAVELLTQIRNVLKICLANTEKVNYENDMHILSIAIKQYLAKTALDRIKENN
jgi:hypothetical protein